MLSGLHNRNCAKIFYLECQLNCNNDLHFVDNFINFCRTCLIFAELICNNNILLSRTFDRNLRFMLEVYHPFLYKTFAHDGHFKPFLLQDCNLCDE